MEWYLRTVLVLQGFVWVQCFLPCPPPDNNETGSPLFLTPYLERGQINDARRLAQVHITKNFQIKSFAGFFTVNKTYNSNHFFWYFPAILENEKLTPIIVWLQGGPGKSSLIGLFAENGPIFIKKNHFHQRLYNWAVNHHVIYIDNPVGTGFSFTDDSRGYCRDETQVGEQLYSSITQFFQLFPELRENPFYVTGECYAGKFVPALAYTIHKKNPKAEVKINLKGIAIGNGWSDPENQLVYSKYLYETGLIDWNEARVLEEYENTTRYYIRHKQWDSAADTLLKFSTFISSNTGFNNFFFNYLHRNNYYKHKNIMPMLRKPCVRRAIHVGNVPLNDIHGSVVVNTHLRQDYTQSVAPWIAELLDHYHALFYNGQLDISEPYPLTVNFLRKLKFSESKRYKNAERRAWVVDKEVRGYSKQAMNLLEVMIRNSGHSVSVDQPQWALDLITCFTHRKLLGTSVVIQDGFLHYTYNN